MEDRVDTETTPVEEQAVEPSLSLSQIQAELDGMREQAQRLQNSYWQANGAIQALEQLVRMAEGAAGPSDEPDLDELGPDAPPPLKVATDEDEESDDAGPQTD